MNKTDYLSLHETKSSYSWKLKILGCPDRNSIRTLDNQEIGRGDCLYRQSLISLVFHYLKIQLFSGHKQS